MFERRGVFVVFDGIDGCGKSTQLRMTADWLRGQGIEVVTSKEPTDKPWGARLRASQTLGRLSPADEVEHFLRDRRQHVDELIVPSLERGAWVLLDRYYYSTVAYQGRRGFDPADLLAQNEAFAPAPDLAFFFVLPIEAASDRIGSRGSADTFEALDEQREVAALFDAIDRPYIRRLAATGTPDDVQERVRTALRDTPACARWIRLGR